jgi:hypothetical protein
LLIHGKYFYMADKVLPQVGADGVPKSEHMKARKLSILGKLPSSEDWEFDIDEIINPFLPHSQLHRLPRWLSHWLGYRDHPQDEVGNLLVAFWACLGTFCGLIVVTALFRFSKDIQSVHPPVIFASLVSSVVQSS